MRDRVRRRRRSRRAEKLPLFPDPPAAPAPPAPRPEPGEGEGALDAGDVRLAGRGEEDEIVASFEDLDSAAAADPVAEPEPRPAAVAAPSTPPAQEPEPELPRGPGPDLLREIAEVAARHSEPQAGGETERDEAGGPRWSFSTARPSAEATPVERPASAGERGRAAVVDAGLVGALWAVVVYFASRIARVPVEALTAAWPFLIGFLVALGLAYATYFTGVTGQTPGKLLAGLRVVDAAGRPPGAGRSLARAVLGTAGIVLVWLGLAPMLFDPARRALHDRVFRTRVVRR